MTPRCSDFTLGFVLKWECDWPNDKTGQYSNDPSDPGGKTRWGIDASSHPGVDIRNLTLKGAMTIYYAEWVREGCETMPPKVGEIFFDAAVNCGIRRARQFSLYATPLLMVEARESFYHRLAVARTSLDKYLPGWLDRTADLKKFLQLT